MAMYVGGVGSFTGEKSDVRLFGDLQFYGGPDITDFHFGHGATQIG